MSITATAPPCEAKEPSAIPSTPRVADACAVVLFGASGDLAMRKLLPALYNLKTDGLLS